MSSQFNWKKYKSTQYLNVIHLETAFRDEKAHGYDSLASVLARPRMSKPYRSPTPRAKLMQQKTTNPPPPRTQKGAKTLSNPHQCPILPRGWGGGGWGLQLTGA